MEFASRNGVTEQVIYRVTVYESALGSGWGAKSIDQVRARFDVVAATGEDARRTVADFMGYDSSSRGVRIEAKPRKKDGGVVTVLIKTETE